MVNLLFLGVPILNHFTVAESVNSVDPDEVAQHEPPHLDPHCLFSNLGTLFDETFSEILLM